MEDKILSAIKELVPTVEKNQLVVEKAPLNPSYQTPLQTKGFQLVKSNMKELYNKSSSMKWNESAKLKEMCDPEGYFLFVCRGETLLAFAYFLITVEETMLMPDDIYKPAAVGTVVEIPVLYCMELQVCETCQNQGWGSFLIENLEKIATGLDLSRVMLTVLANNVKAIQFYLKRHFKSDYNSPNVIDTLTDLSNPGDLDLEDDYIIYYKVLSR